ncbi:MAG: type I restriction-modification system subunit M [Desulfohalobiaceae bacterium]|nr:type I restriction-modification system subunit M [Desulfohalobiaceae bacterium]
MTANTTRLIQFVFDIANKLRGPYRPPQYRKVMLPMTVLRRLDCVLAPTKEHVLQEYDKLQVRGLEGEALHRVLARKASKDRTQPLYNISPYTFEKLLADPENIATNLVSYINGFSESARLIFEMFGFESEIEKLDKSNRLYLIVKAFTDPKIKLHPDQISNHAMGYVFEELVRKFNEQANEEAGDHFTPREVIRLMAHLLYTGDEAIYTPGIARTIYDPTCGTGGMLSVSEEYITEQNPQAHLELFGQEYNEEAYAICRSDLLIKDEPVENIVFGDTLGDGESFDGHPDKTFHYMLANPPFGVEWKPQEDHVKKEHAELGFSGRFGPGLPRINDGATLFLLHMISKMKTPPENDGEGSKIAIVFNGSPLFNGEPGPSESNIRRWIIENDWLDAIIALPDQLFYNTGIYTYIWLVSNRKPDKRKGKVQLIDGTRHYRKMKKSLGNKRNELAEEHIDELTRLYADFFDGATCKVWLNGELEERVCSKIFDNRDFGYLKVTVERPLRLNFQASPERSNRLWQETAFINLAKSKKRKNQAEQQAEIEAGKARQQRIIHILQGMDATYCYMDRPAFEEALRSAFKQADEKLPAPVKKGILSALSRRDPQAAICFDSKGNPEPDPELRDTEIVPLPSDIPLPLPIGYAKDADNSDLLTVVRDHCEAYLDREVLPFVDDAWIDHGKTKVGYEIPINRHFYVYKPPRPLEEIENDIHALEQEILDRLKKVTS